jgi:hypothetical protein
MRLRRRGIHTIGLKKLDVPILAEKDCFQLPKLLCWYEIVPPGSNEYCKRVEKDMRSKETDEPQKVGIHRPVCMLHASSLF